MTHNTIVQKLWNLCNVLRDDGINYSDYVSELVLLLFLKMAHENKENGVLKNHPLPEGYRWEDLKARSGLAQLNFYRKLLVALSTDEEERPDPSDSLKTITVPVHGDRLISAIYADAATSLREPKHLAQIIKRFDEIEDWFDDEKDGLGDLYEGLLEKNANETKSGAGQYFTPRALIDSMIACVQPQAGEMIQDPAAGTAGFLIAAHTAIKKKTDDLYDLTLEEQQFQINKAYIGIELVPNTRRLALMNCLLHGMEGDDEGVIHLGNALGGAGKNLAPADVILANPPFGTSKGGEASVTRDDFTYETSNKQLLFLQHIYKNLKPGGRAAVVLPDNVLFETGVGTKIRQELMAQCNLHTILRLPTGIFYAHGVKTNVLFFTKGAKNNPDQFENCTEQTWVYDLRTNMPSFGKRTPFTRSYLTPFEKLYGASERTEGDWSHSETTEKNLDNSRWRCFSRDWIKNDKDDSLDITWMKDQDSLDAETLEAPEVLAQDAQHELKLATQGIASLLKSFKEMA